MEWRFKKLTRNDVLQNASHLEFFHNDALSSAVDALVREDIQNRLDAKVASESLVEVRYRFCGPRSVAGMEDTWFRGLKDHLSSDQVSQELGYTPQIDHSLHWLVIEDFFTTGLEGDTEQFQDSENTSQRNDFFWFIRNVGRSGKTGSDRGRWGLGKIVYPASSKLRSFMAFTTRRSDNRRLLIGRSVLAVHHFNGNQHDSEGFWGNFDNPEYDYFATPSIDDTTLDAFQEAFELTRTKDEPGLSIVVPYPNDDISWRGLLRSLVEHWFWVILQGRLRVRVAAEGEEHLVDRDTVEDIVRRHFPEGLPKQHMLRQLQFARDVQSLTSSHEDSWKLLNQAGSSAPKWDGIPEMFESPDAVEIARAKFQDGRLVRFVIPLSVRKTNGAHVQVSNLVVHLQRSPEPHPPVEVFLRDGLTISGQRYLRETGAIALVMPEEGAANNALGTLLGDAENPAHTKWERSGKHFHNRYRYGPSILSFVQRAANNLVAFLSKRPEGRNNDLLQQLFHLPESGEQPTKVKTKGDGKVAPPPAEPPPPRNLYLSCSRIPGGFLVRPHPKATRLPAGFQVRAAYEVVRGNPFNHHHPADFDFASRKSDIIIDGAGLTYTSMDANRFTATIDHPEFELAVTGFDANRDLIVDVRPIHDSPDAEGDSPGQIDDVEALVSNEQ